MRSRYSAYVVKNIDYLGASLHPDHRGDWDRDGTRDWAENAEWLGLEIVSTEAGGEDDDSGTVEFIANMGNRGGKARKHHEISTFQRVDGRWYYVDGGPPKVDTVRHEQPKVGRNDACPCGSGKKYKKCCGR